MSVVELIQAGNMSPRLAALFWVAMERGASIIIAAGPPSSGKTTTLSALLAFTPPETLVYFTRGVDEPFALPALSDSHHTYILINELSDHIPVYTWDDNARRAFELLSMGYRLGSTMHADTVEGVLEQLGGDLAIPHEQIAKLTLIVPLHVGRFGAPIRRVQEVALLQPNGAGLTVANLASWRQESDTFEVLADPAAAAAFAAWAGLSGRDLETELDRREGFLERLIKSGVASIPEVGAAIEAFYEKGARGEKAAEA
jgi:hypothetical protein